MRRLFAPLKMGPAAVFHGVRIQGCQNPPWNSGFALMSNFLSAQQTFFKKMVRSEEVVRSEVSDAVPVAFELGLQLSCKFRAFWALSPQYRGFRLFTDFITFSVYLNLPERSISSSGSASISKSTTLLERFVAINVASSRTFLDFLENFSFVDSLFSSGGKIWPSGPPGSPVSSFHCFHLKIVK